MSILTTFFLSLSASSPILGGKLLTKDTWIEALERGCDDRNPNEWKSGAY